MHALDNPLIQHPTVGGLGISASKSGPPDAISHLHYRTTSPWNTPDVEAPCPAILI